MGRDERSSIAEVAARLGVPSVIMDCEAPPAVVRWRLESRALRSNAVAQPAL